ncbi:hypothetical protein [Paenibacillus polymyxa]|uniref:hypothetical protein n=1 Tax=Paenibacillus polymyxa TaxID=1406 RepID=UPI00321655CD
MYKLRTKIMDSGNISMYDTQNPLLTAGRYELTAVHEIDYDNDSPILAETKKVFHVKGAQYALESESLAPMHPPEKSKGDFGHVLPHLTFAKPGLLWERELKLSNGDKLPWLSLLLLREDEWPGNGEPQTTTVGQFRQQTNHSLFVPELEDLQDDELDANCRFIEISLEQFNEFMPEIDTMHLYAGARINSDTVGKPEKKGISVINAHRFPITSDSKKEGNQFCVYLVSLEGLEPCLEGSLQPQIDRVRMMCLYHWKFTALPENGESFRELLEKLINSSNEETRDNWLRYPETILEGSAEDYLQQRLSDGYVPLIYHTISGEETLAWYRSPFVPVKDIPAIPSKETFTLSESMIYDAEHGIFDLSWSVAMNLGRLLALSNGSVAINLMKWRKQLTDYISSQYLAPKIDPVETFEQGFRSLWAVQVTNAMDYEALHYVQTVKRRSWRRDRRSARAHPIKKIKEIIGSKEIPDFDEHLIMNDPSTYVINWAKQTTDQVAIPIANMVPIESMLPMERIRFFRSDPHWLQFFIEGVISIGVQTQFDAHVNRYIKNMVSQGIDHSSFGLLLRSALVSGWPALKIKGTSTSGDDAGAYEPIRLQEQIMLTLFRDIPNQITITEPQESLSFGMNDNKTITLRYITGTQAGDIVMKPGPTGEKPVTVDIEDCISLKGVLNTKKCIEKFVKEIPGAPSEDLWQPTHHTLQLLNGADQGCFDIPI